MKHSIIAKVSTARFPPATASKRFIGDLSAGYIQQLSERGRRFLAFIAHRFRRQYELTEAEWAWVNEQLSASTKRMTPIEFQGTLFPPGEK